MINNYLYFNRINHDSHIFDNQTISDKDKVIYIYIYDYIIYIFHTSLYNNYNLIKLYK